MNNIDNITERLGNMRFKKRKRLPNKNLNSLISKLRTMKMKTLIENPKPPHVPKISLNKVTKSLGGLQLPKAFPVKRQTTKRRGAKRRGTKRRGTNSRVTKSRGIKSRGTLSTITKSLADLQLPKRYSTRIRKIPNYLKGKYILSFKELNEMLKLST